MKEIFWKNLSKRLQRLKASQGVSVFSISTTMKQENSSYFTPVRSSRNFTITGCIIFDERILSRILSTIDGVVDIILVDSEKKIPIKTFGTSEKRESTDPTIGYVETGSISKIAFQEVSKSKVYEFKPNDITVDAAWMFISHKFKYLSGRKICILGAGNIGSKLALRLVECGAEVHIYRRDSYKGFEIAHGLNLIKPDSVIANVQYHTNILHASFMADVVIGATNGFQIIDTCVIESVKKNCLIVELGKNNITRDALDLIRDNSLEIYRTDITPAIESYIYQVLRTQKIIENSYGRRQLEFCSISGGGYYALEGDIVVDQIEKPKEIFGIADGMGSLKKHLTESEESVIEKVRSQFNIEST